MLKQIHWVNEPRFVRQLIANNYLNSNLHCFEWEAYLGFKCFFEDIQHLQSKHQCQFCQAERHPLSCASVASYAHAELSVCKVAFQYTKLYCDNTF